MGSEWQAMDGAARQGKRKSKGGLWLWKTPRGSGRLQPGAGEKDAKTQEKYISPNNACMWGFLLPLYSSYIVNPPFFKVSGVRVPRYLSPGT